MKKYWYVLIEAGIFIAALIFLVCPFIVIFSRPFIVVITLAGSLYYIGKIILGIKLIIDIIQGPCKADTIFMGNACTESMDIFNIWFTHVFFDDDILTKGYLLFEDVCFDTLRPGDKVTVVYYKRSRILTMLCKCDGRSI